ncbi:hypothetical protein SODALDRAFT_375364 [Sodiomyces alkalinus F11]|uniref:Uncharacterized protein n=1 Tax=Sodiomyces alkalinus (strain CBS 110278 / VKM F-3762 / F11) TaxID=1314773 RepID=A0A3N2Q8P3_SODAK|nr:hypothetical protein SODALDRAFT_375364 [Sodiomyces alkalinus F11]ROT43151.1 hypothetical protein SODALDRAFT_375364 [Sodiomyces alkalinus F11]
MLHLGNPKIHMRNNHRTFQREKSVTLTISVSLIPSFLQLVGEFEEGSLTTFRSTDSGYNVGSCIIIVVIFSASFIHHVYVASFVSQGQSPSADGQSGNVPGQGNSSEVAEDSGACGIGCTLSGRYDGRYDLRFASPPFAGLESEFQEHLLSLPTGWACACACPMMVNFFPEATSPSYLRIHEASYWAALPDNSHVTRFCDSRLISQSFLMSPSLLLSSTVLQPDQNHRNTSARHTETQDSKLGCTAPPPTSTVVSSQTLQPEVLGTREEQTRARKAFCRNLDPIWSVLLPRTNKQGGIPQFLSLAINHCAGSQPHNHGCPQLANNFVLFLDRIRACLRDEKPLQQAVRLRKKTTLGSGHEHIDDYIETVRSPLIERIHLTQKKSPNISYHSVALLTGVAMCQYYAHVFVCKHLTFAFARFCHPASLIQKPCSKRQIWHTIHLEEACDECIMWFPDKFPAKRRRGD